MRVCLVTGSFPDLDCGVGDYSWHLARHLARDLAVTVVTSDRLPIHRFLAREAGSHERTVVAGDDAARKTIDARNGGLDVRPVVRSWGLAGLPFLRRTVLACRPDVVHIQYATSAFDLGAGVHGLARVLQGRMRRLPVVTTVHDPSGPRLFPKAGPLRAALVRRLCRDSALICCPDLPVRDWMSANGFADRIRQIPVGVNVLPASDAGSGEADRAARAREHLRARHPMLLEGGQLLVTFGNLHPEKDYESVFGALQRITQRASESRAGAGLALQWVLIGGGGRDADLTRARELRQLAQRTRTGVQVHFLGYCAAEEASAWLSAADICLLPLPQGATDARGSLLAALAHGRPTVVIGPGVFSEYLRDGEHLCWSPSRDPERLAVLLEALLRDTRRRHRLGRSARAVIEREYGWDRIAERTRVVYRIAADRGSGCGHQSIGSRREPEQALAGRGERR
jgi:glycosyltransferase involved in cell wall biosynthesis